jgi:hypothetical protein
MKYVIYKDYLENTHHIGYEYITVDVMDAFQLFEEADRLWREDRDRLYLMRIMKKIPKMSFKQEGGWRGEYYEAVMCKRSEAGGWHRNNEDFSENPHVVRRYYKKDLEYFDLSRMS